MKAPRSRNERTSEHAMQTRTTLALLLALLAICLSGCGAIPDDIFNADSGSSGGGQSPTDQGRSADLTVAEYAKQCAEHRVPAVGDYDTSYEAVTALTDMVDGLRGISPPSEIAEMHRARLELLDELIKALSQQSPDRTPGLLFPRFYPELHSANGDYNKSQYSVSPEARQLLLDEGCTSRRSIMNQ